MHNIIKEMSRYVSGLMTHEDLTDSYRMSTYVLESIKKLNDICSVYANRINRLKKKNPLRAKQILKLLKSEKKVDGHWIIKKDPFKRVELF